MKILSDTPPSEDFEQAFGSNCSGCVRTCACGRKLFDIENSYDWEEGELEGLLANAKKDPDRYVALPYSVSTMSIDGKEWVMGCPCNGGRRFQNFIDHHDRQIADYLRQKAKNLEQHAQEIAVP